MRETTKVAKRIHLKREKMRKRFVLVSGDIPAVGEICTLNGQDWQVVKVEDTEILAEFASDGARLRQVFP